MHSVTLLRMYIRPCCTLPYIVAYSFFAAKILAGSSYSIPVPATCMYPLRGSGELGTGSLTVSTVASNGFGKGVQCYMPACLSVCTVFVVVPVHVLYTKKC